MFFSKGLRQLCTKYKSDLGKSIMTWLVAILTVN